MDQIERLYTDYKTRVYTWFLSFASRPNSTWWLASFSFIESVFFPIPPDPLLIPIIVANRSRWFFYASTTIIASVVGGIAGYFIGILFFDLLGKPIIAFYGLESELETVRDVFNKNAFWAVFLAAFSPLPYKIFTIGAGFFEINFVEFILASIVGRATRFYLVGYLAFRYGAMVGEYIFKSAKTFLFFVTISVILLFVFLNLFL